MYCIGIDVGSTFTKYCVMADRNIDFLFMERTPIRQREYFKEKLASFMEEYPDAKVTSCGYGKRNVSELKSINELTALAKGFFFVTGKDGIILDIGGQDTKIISQENGKLKKFFINDKCAAGSGMFLSNILDMIGIKFQDIDLTLKSGIPISLSSTCAVFAQSDIVELIANNRTEQEILQAVIWQIFVMAKPLLSKVDFKPLLLSGGLSQIRGIASFASDALGRKCTVAENGMYLASIGCALSNCIPEGGAYDTAQIHL